MDNYRDFCELTSTRQALHVGDIEFMSGDVYGYMPPVIMDNSRDDVELCLENYRFNSVTDLVTQSK